MSVAAAPSASADQLALYSRKELKPGWLTRAEVEANMERREGPLVDWLG